MPAEPRHGYKCVHPHVSNHKVCKFLGYVENDDAYWCEVSRCYVLAGNGCAVSWPEEQIEQAGADFLAARKLRVEGPGG